MSKNPVGKKAQELIGKINDLGAADQPDLVAMRRFHGQLRKLLAKGRIAQELSEEAKILLNYRQGAMT